MAVAMLSNGRDDGDVLSMNRKTVEVAIEIQAKYLTCYLSITVVTVTFAFITFVVITLVEVTFVTFVAVTVCI